MEPKVERDRGVDNRDIVLFMGEADDQKVANVIAAADIALPTTQMHYSERSSGDGKVVVGTRIMNYGGLPKDEAISRLRYTFTSYGFIEL